MLKSSTLRISLVVITVIMLFMVSSCGSSDNAYVVENSEDALFSVESPVSNDFGFANGAEAEEKYESAVEEKYESEAEYDDDERPVQTGRKIIRTSWADIQTKKYDESLAALKTLCNKYDAYFESSSNYGNRLDYATERRSEFVIRVPIAKFDEFCNEVGNIGSVVESGENNTDITEKYIDTEARLDSAKLREERVLQILANADKLDDVLALEKELADIRYEIETMTGTLRKYDSLVSYATFRLTLNEVVEYTAPAVVPKTFGERVSQSFSDGLRDFSIFWQNVAIAITYNLFAIITFLVIAAIIVVVSLALSNRSKKKAEKRMAEYRERAAKINAESEKKPSGKS